jgi:hypothetical protein
MRQTWDKERNYYTVSVGKYKRDHLENLTVDVSKIFKQKLKKYEVVEGIHLSLHT